MNNKLKVFLGGTCANSTWREQLIPMLKSVDYFNPIVEDWTPECQKEELEQRENCDLVLYVITPEMEGVYSIAEVVDDSNKRPKKTIFCVLSKTDNGEFSKGQLKSLKAVSKLVANNGGKVCSTLCDVAGYLEAMSITNYYRTKWS